MPTHVRTPAVTLNASTTSTNAQLVPNGSAARYIRVTASPGSGLVYLSAGSATVAATAANLAMNQGTTVIVERDPTTDLYLGATMSGGTALISAALIGFDSP